MATRKISAVLIDLSGTLHVEDVATAGAVEGLKRLRQNNVKMKFVTNTTKEPKRLLFERLQKIGFDIRQEEIFTSLSAARQLVQQRNLRPYYMLESSALEDFEGISSQDPNCVLVGLAPSAFNYDRMNAAFRLLLDGATLVAVHKGRYYKRKDGLALGPGAFVSGLEYATGAKAEVVGKPEGGFFRAALEGLGVSAEEAIMVGDDSRDDVGGAQAAGIRGILVKTGKYREGDETIINPPPTFLAQDFAEAVDYIMKNLL